MQTLSKKENRRPHMGRKPNRDEVRGCSFDELHARSQTKTTVMRRFLSQTLRDSIRFK
jgi:hypothetical protein